MVSEAEVGFVSGRMVIYYDLLMLQNLVAMVVYHVFAVPRNPVVMIAGLIETRMEVGVVTQANLGPGNHLAPA